MPTLYPSEVVNPIVHRDDIYESARKFVWSVHANPNELGIGDAVRCIPTTLADKSISKVIDEVVVEDCGIAASNTFTVARGKTERRISRKGRGVIVVVVLQRTANEHVMVPIAGDVVVEFRNVGVELCRISGRKGVGFDIQAIPRQTGVW